jgi:hypothetical protein
MATYTTQGDVSGGCDHQHKTLRSAQACADKYQAQVKRGNPGGNAYSDRVVVNSDGSSLDDYDREQLHAIESGAY